MIFIAVLSTGVPSYQKDELVVRGSAHPSLLLTAEACVNIAPAVIQLFRYEQGFGI
jgi:hypothetical protein